MREERLPKVCGYQNRELDDIDRGIIAVIFYWLNETGDCHVSIGTFARHLGVWPTTIQRHLRKLRRLHYVRRDLVPDPMCPKGSKKKHLPSQYRLGSRIYQQNDVLTASSPKIL